MCMYSVTQNGSIELESTEEIAPVGKAPQWSSAP